VEGAPYAAGDIEPESGQKAMGRAPVPRASVIRIPSSDPREVVPRTDRGGRRGDQEGSRGSTQ
jgi:hypothetical protein